MMRGIKKKIESLYQQWSTVPQSLVLTSNYPKQLVMIKDGVTWICYSQAGTFYVSAGNIMCTQGWGLTYLSAGAWKTDIYTRTNSGTLAYDTITEANSDVFTDASLSAVFFAKTT